MKRFLLFVLFLSFHSNAHRLCVDTVTRRNDNPIGTKIEGPLQNITCTCACKERRYGDNNRCITCNHRHSGDTSAPYSLFALQDTTQSLLTLFERVALLKRRFSLHSNNDVKKE